MTPEAEKLLNGLPDKEVFLMIEQAINSGYDLDQFRFAVKKPVHFYDPATSSFPSAMTASYTFSFRELMKRAWPAIASTSVPWLKLLSFGIADGSLRAGNVSVVVNPSRNGTELRLHLTTDDQNLVRRLVHSFQGLSSHEDIPARQVSVPVPSAPPVDKFKEFLNDDSVGAI